MSKRNKLKEVITDESGVSILEYALIISMASIAAIGALIALGNKVNTTFLNNAAGQIP